MSLKDQILGADDIPTERVTVEEWGGAEIQLRGLDVASFTAIGKATLNKDGDVDLRRMYAQLVIKGAYDPATNQPVFSDADEQALASKSMRVMERLTKKINTLSGMGDDGDMTKAVNAEGKDS